MTSIAVVDTGPLYAAADTGDVDHDAVIPVLARGDLRFVFPVLVITEAAQMVGRWLGATAEARFVRQVADLDVALPSPDDWRRIAELVERYGDFALGSIDASVVALAERLDTELVVTLDHRHFRAVKPNHRDAFTLLP